MTPDFSKSNGLVPCIIQDATTQHVLMLGFMNDAAYQQTLSERVVTFYSRSKGRLWTKGESSGNFLDVVEILLDCDFDTLLVKVNPRGAVCHTGKATCFGERNERSDLSWLEEVIRHRQLSPSANSYTSNLLAGEINKVAQKLGEEAVELVIESMNGNEQRFLEEAADLMFHYLVLLRKKGFDLESVVRVLRKRAKEAVENNS